MADLWWSQVKCPVDGTVCTCQRWGADNYRVTCELCGWSMNAKTPDGLVPS